MVHFAWDFLTSADRDSLCASFRSIRAYAKLRLFASARPSSAWSTLSSMGPIELAPASLSIHRAHLMAAALLCVDFWLGDLIRWLGGVYTHDHIPLDPIRAAIVATRDIPPPPGYPSVDWDRAFHTLH